MTISELTTGTSLTGFFLLSSAAKKTTVNGKPFLSATLSDKSGSIPAVCWDYTGEIDESCSNKPVKIQGLVSEYRGTKQLNIDRIRLAVDGDPFAISDLVPTAPIDPDDAIAEIEELLGTLSDPDYRAVALKMLEVRREAFVRHPAAKSVHHAFLGGLMMHTLNMLRTANFVASLYAEVLDRSLLLTGTFLHDLAKIEELAASETGLVSDYSVEGELLGHLVMGAMSVRDVCVSLGTPAEKALLLQHMVLSHHGLPEFGAAVAPRCAEAEALSYIDMLDSRMEIYAEKLLEVEEGQFTDRIFALDNKRLYKHEITD